MRKSYQRRGMTANCLFRYWILDTGYYCSDPLVFAGELGEGTSPLHSRGSGGVSPPSSGE